MWMAGEWASVQGQGSYWEWTWRLGVDVEGVEGMEGVDGIEGVERWVCWGVSVGRNVGCKISVVEGTSDGTTLGVGVGHCAG